MPASSHKGCYQLYRSGCRNCLMSPVTRRIFVVTVAAVVGTVLARSSTVFGDAPADNIFLEDLGQIFRGDRFASAQAIGREYLRYFPAEANKPKLASLICGEFVAPDGRDPWATREWVRAR